VLVYLRSSLIYKLPFLSMSTFSDNKGSNNSWKTSVPSSGEFKRKESQFRNSVTADGSSGFKAEPGRYHLYVSYACPWAHRTLIMRRLKGLEDVISFDTVHYLLEEGGWHFSEEYPDSVNHSQFLKQNYLLSQPDYSGNITVPVLWDKKTSKIVNNESAEIIRMLNSEFTAFAKNPQLDFYPKELRATIDDVNGWVYPTINNGVYRCGFAQKQEAYETAFKELFSSLDRVEDILSKQRYLISKDRLTEADIRLFTTLIRFDPVYYTHFKCNGRHLLDYPNIWGFVRELYQMPEIKETVNFEHIKKHYYMSHKMINPFGIVPIGPLYDLNTPHGRGKL